jgi:molecular chaperone DnaK (HSP70)
MWTENEIVFKPVSIVSGAPVRYEGKKREIIQEIIAEALEIDISRVRVVSEPILAAIAYNYFFGEANRPVLAFDVGHGTFDTAVLIPNPKAHIEGEEKFIAQSSDGNFNAGLKIEERLISEMVKRMKANPGRVSSSGRMQAERR